jgi:hypothetical protein
VSKNQWLVVGALLLLLVLACSPEASRTREGGPGADVGNHSRNSPEPSTAPTLVARP